MNPLKVHCFWQIGRRCAGRILFCFCVLQLVSTVYGQSPTEQQADSQGTAPTAILTNLGGMAQRLALWLPGGPPVVLLDEIDTKGPKDFGKRGKWFGGKFKVALTPGQHSLTVEFFQGGYNNSYSGSTVPVNVSFVAESGHTYVVECNVDHSSGRWIPFVVDLTDKARPRIVPPPPSCTTADECRTQGTKSLAAGTLLIALADLAKAIELKPGDAEVYAARADTKFHLGDYDGSITDYAKAIELNPALAQHYYVSRAIVKVYEDDLDGAVGDYTKAIEIKPDDWSAYKFRGDANRERCDLDGAIADYTKSIEIMPGSAASADAYSGRSTAKRANGDLTGAIADCAEATRLSSARSSCEASPSPREGHQACKPVRRRTPPPPVPHPPPS